MHILILFIRACATSDDSVFFPCFSLARLELRARKFPLDFRERFACQSIGLWSSKSAVLRFQELFNKTI